MLRLMDRYIGKQIISATLFGVAMLCVLLVLGNLFKELRPLMVESNASLLTIGSFVLSVIPFSLIYTIPWGFLVAVLLVFGRLSAENELVSMRMAGVGLFRIAMPVFVLGALLSVLCLWLNISMAPKAKDTIKFVLYEAVKENPNALLDPGVVQTRFKNQKIFVESREGNILYGLHMYELQGDENTGYPTKSIYAREAKLKIIKETKQLRLHLTDAYIETRNEKNDRELIFIGEQEPLLFDFSAERKKSRKASTMTNEEIHQLLHDEPELEGKKRYKLANEIHRRYAFSLACLALCLVGVPLGINARRRETSTGLAISIVVALGYFLFFAAAEQFQDKSGSTALFLYWLPNVLCLALGTWLFFKARRK
ncbi:LptF/LptG family permease [Verrucomicrobiaceae bacterium 5K15]|uniref:LptF/LptG family permease n=2 Tax=Oceaniferula flava TaxID=2800421 RepID=A0AAE2SCR5_9BACT|nr:LptF/LptG family permease [Oceaniferula flavus]MBM1135431.1 LptF/LptG family permease [Oceaniferula flavus]